MKLSNAFLQGMKQRSDNLHITTYDLKTMNLKNCSGCFSCWNSTERKCIHDDDMTFMLQSYIKADLIIWVTPLYHYTMTSLTKCFIERTLPIHSPLIIDDGSEYSHPPLYESTAVQKHILISTCGFPESHNFDLLKKEMKRITGDKIVQEICCVMGELLRQKGLESTISWYLSCVKQAGIEFIDKGRFSNETDETLKKPLVDIESFIEMANLNWDGHSSGSEVGDKVKPVAKGLRFLTQMSFAFNKKNGLNLNDKIEFEFTDLQENAYFHINNDQIEVLGGKAENPSLKIITTFDSWTGISEGRIDGAQAMMEGLYRIEGAMGLMRNMDRLFGRESDFTSSNSDVSKVKFYGLKGYSWMSVSFIPWIISWIFIENKPVLATFLPLTISLVVLILKKRVRAVTYFEKMNMIYFLGLSAFVYFYGVDITLFGSYLNYFSIATIWAVSIFGNVSLTADYSIYSEGTNLVGNPLFDLTNEILSLFWALVFVSQGLIKIWMDSAGLGRFSPLVYILLFAALRFTSFFSSWYPAYVAKGGKVRFQMK
jgi:multimeric flavodoxin WrbA/putative sterol carrier protein